LRADVAAADELPRFTVEHLPAMQNLLMEMQAAKEPLPAICAQKMVAVAGQTDPSPFAHLAANRLGRRIGVMELSRSWAFRHVKADPVLRELAQDVGFVGAWARHAAVIPRADTGKPVPWTEPLADEDVEVMAGYVLTACLVLTCALSGMRTSENGAELHLMQHSAGSKYA
jgi:hypothetical protein